ncbi:hypothetical protein [Pectobacterium parmentieri]|uniref:SMODS and SLOG-associating 2TM effector domain-containing protein n=1 Tax=Pectobacterium parmentieri TaxID=1905730 RepID=A0A0H3HXJ1_PECPM|nr:hypothetical protein [Pectobacterium parmentieri]AFI88596.1 Hypothetical protein W5S_0470 [Pectobacterium parmentieri]
MNKLSSIEDNINHFRLRAHRKARAHYLFSKSLSNRHVWFGISIIFITTLIGSGVVLDISKSSSHFTPQLLGFLSLVAAILSSFQTFLVLKVNLLNISPLLVNTMYCTER